MSNFTSGQKVDFRGDEMIFATMYKGDAILIKRDGHPTRVLIEAVNPPKTDTEKAFNDMMYHLKMEGIVTYDSIMLKILIEKFKGGKIHGVTWSKS